VTNLHVIFLTIFVFYCQKLYICIKLKTIKKNNYAKI